MFRLNNETAQNVLSVMYANFYTRKRIPEKKIAEFKKAVIDDLSNTNLLCDSDLTQENFIKFAKRMYVPFNEKLFRKEFIKLGNKA